LGLGWAGRASERLPTAFPQVRSVFSVSEGRL
jgi:hypothetical protein